jgi:hypothetical protein
MLGSEIFCVWSATVLRNLLGIRGFGRRETRDKLFDTPAWYPYVLRGTPSAGLEFQIYALHNTLASGLLPSLCFLDSIRRDTL